MLCRNKRNKNTEYEELNDERVRKENVNPRMTVELGLNRIGNRSRFGEIERLLGAGGIDLAATFNQHVPQFGEFRFPFGGVHAGWCQLGGA